MIPLYSKKIRDMKGRLGIPMQIIINKVVDMNHYNPIYFYKGNIC